LEILDYNQIASHIHFIIMIFARFLSLVQAGVGAGNIPHFGLLPNLQRTRL
jgi:hypothetical protein